MVEGMIGGSSACLPEFLVTVTPAARLNNLSCSTSTINTVDINGIPAEALASPFGVKIDPLRFGTHGS